MSGSGGSYLEPSTPVPSLTTLVFKSQLESPKAGVVTQLSVGDVLDVAFEQPGNQQVSLCAGTARLLVRSLIHDSISFALA